MRTSEHVNTPTAGGSQTHSPAGFLEPVREFETSRLGTSLSAEQRTSDEALTAERVTFPRASSATDNEYWAAYFRQCRPLMREWVTRQLSDFDDVFGLSAATESDALTIVTEDAERELLRELNANERKLLKSVTRDLVIVTTAKRAATELRAIAAIMAPDDESATTAASFADHVARVVEYRAAQATTSQNTHRVNS